MICRACTSEQHDKCDDTVHPDRTYRSCGCQHKTTVEAEPVTGPAGE